MAGSAGACRQRAVAWVSYDPGYLAVVGAEDVLLENGIMEDKIIRRKFTVMPRLFLDQAKIEL